MISKTKFLYWAPRIICIIAILFISMFALDAFESGLTFWQQIGAFLLHLVPSFILSAVLLIAWKWEYVGGILLTIIGLGLTPLVFIKNYQMNHSVWMSLGVILSITIPFVLVGILFIFSSYQQKKNPPIK